jgi:hypothetical protein
MLFAIFQMIILPFFWLAIFANTNMILNVNAFVESGWEGP